MLFPCSTVRHHFKKRRFSVFFFGKLSHFDLDFISFKKNTIFLHIAFHRESFGHMCSANTEIKMGASFN